MRPELIYEDLESIPEVGLQVVEHEGAEESHWQVMLSVKQCDLMLVPRHKFTLRA